MPEEFRSLASVLLAARDPAAAAEPAFDSIEEPLEAESGDCEELAQCEDELLRDVRLFHAHLIEAVECARETLMTRHCGRCFSAVNAAGAGGYRRRCRHCPAALFRRGAAARARASRGVRRGSVRPSRRRRRGVAARRCGDRTACGVDRCALGRAARIRFTIGGAMIARGVVRSARAGVIEASIPGIAVGEGVCIRAKSGSIGGVVSGVLNGRAFVAAHDAIEGIASGDPACADPDALCLPLGTALLGRCIDARGVALDGGPPVRGRNSRITPAAPLPGRTRSYCGCVLDRRTRDRRHADLGARRARGHFRAAGGGQNPRCFICSLAGRARIRWSRDSSGSADARRKSGFASRRVTHRSSARRAIEAPPNGFAPRASPWRRPAPCAPKVCTCCSFWTVSRASGRASRTCGRSGRIRRPRRLPGQRFCRSRAVRRSGWACRPRIDHVGLDRDLGWR